MISATLLALEKGFRIMRTNSRMLLVGILVFVFPLLFVWITQSFFTTAYDNIQTADDRRLGTIHEAISVALNYSEEATDEMGVLVKQLAETNDDVTTLRVLIPTKEGYFIKYANDPKVIGTENPPNRLLTDVGFTDARNFIRTELLVDNHRVWQAFTRVNTPSGYQYIYSEHNFKTVDDIMAARRQQSYFGLTAIFAFLITLAYWLNRQVNWQKNHQLLEQQLKDRDLFSNMIAHEFRSPLTAIKGYASFLQESKSLSEEELRFTTNIRNAAERLVVLVSDFLEVARLQSGKLQITKTETDLRGILEQVTDDLQVMAEEKNLGLVYTKNSTPVVMITDPARMTQVLTNIVSNAIKYTNKGQVELECKQIPGEVTIRVKDTGTGISAEDQQKLFAPFTRVGGVDSGSTTGTGLGMWITKQLVALLNGTIGVESIKGVGTHVVISFRT